MSRPLLISILLSLLALSLFAGDDFYPATPEELALKDVSWSPGAPAVLLDWTVRHDDIDSRAIEYVRIKVLTEEGKKFGDIRLLSIPQYQQVRGIKARTISPDGSLEEFRGKIYDKVIVRSGGFRAIEKTFTLPNVVPGTIIEYRYVVDWPNTQLRTNRWALQREIPIQRASFWIRPWDRGVASLCATKGLPASQSPIRVRDHFEFEIEKVAAFEAEAFSPPEDELKPRIEFFYTDGDVEKYWTEASRVLAKFVEEYIGNRSGIRKEAAAVTAGAATDEEKLRRIHDRVLRIRNLSYEPEKTEQEEKREKLRDNDNIEEVVRHGYGYSRQINRLFAGLARAAGFDAQMVLVSSRRSFLFTKQLPDVDQLTSEVVVISQGGKDRFFDPGTPYLPFGMLSWENTLAAGLRLKSKKEWEWITTPDQSPDSAQTTRTADLRFEEGTVRGTVTIAYRGHPAVALRIEAKDKDDSANRKSLEDSLKELLPPGSTVKLTKLENLAAMDEPLTATFDVDLPNLSTTAGSRAMLPLAVFESATRNPLAGDARKFPIYYFYQSDTRDSVSLTLPEGYAVESMPQTTQHDLGALDYRIEHARDGRKITLTRRMTVKAVAIGPEHFPVLKRFYGRRTTADHDAVVLRQEAP